MSGKAGLESNTAFRIATEWDAHRGSSGPKACPPATCQKAVPYIHMCPSVDLFQLFPVSNQDLEVAGSSI